MKDTKEKGGVERLPGKIVIDGADASSVRMTIPCHLTRPIKHTIKHTQGKCGEVRDG